MRGISLIDEKPKEILFIKLEGIHLSNIFSLKSLSLVDFSLLLVDIQVDVQINKTSNKVSIP